MEARSLGSQGLATSAIDFGCMNLSPATARSFRTAKRRTCSPAPSFSASTPFDTAELYGPFINERLVGKALRPVRDRAVIAPKFESRIKSGEPRPLGLNSWPDHIRAVCEKSPQRLGLETIDLFYQYRVDPAVPIKDVAGTVGDLVRAG